MTSDEPRYFTVDIPPDQRQPSFWGTWLGLTEDGSYPCTKALGQQRRSLSHLPSEASHDVWTRCLLRSDSNTCRYITIIL